MSDPSFVRFRYVVASALAALESRLDEINDLNVFPVADGDTGTNMALTLRAVLDELGRLESLDRSPDDVGRREIVELVARAAMLGARGNSGVILSQFVRGAAELLASRSGDLIDPHLVAEAMRSASEHADRSIHPPVEGTMLTVMRDMAAAAAGAPRMDIVDDHQQNAAIADLLERMISAGEESVRQTPEKLQVLKDAGVVDAGGYALTVIFAGVLGILRGEPLELAHHIAPRALAHAQHEASEYRFCTNFAVTGAGLDAAHFEGLLKELGDSVIVVSDPARTMLKIHVHTDEPERAMALFAQAGDISHDEIQDMRVQVVEREARLASRNGTGSPQHCGVLAVFSGAGMRELFEGFAADTLDGGPTMNPSPDELLAAIAAVPAHEVVVLPNNANVVMAAQRAAELADKPVEVVATRSQQAGLAAVVALDPDRPAAENAAAMVDALAHVRTGGVAPAAREDPGGRFAVGDAVGYVDEELVAWGEPQATLRDVLARLAEGAELITCLEGVDAPLDEQAVAALVPPGVELEHEPGGQPAWWWLLSAE